MENLKHQNQLLSARVRELEFKLYGTCSTANEIEDSYKITRIQPPSCLEEPVLKRFKLTDNLVDYSANAIKLNPE